MHVSPPQFQIHAFHRGDGTTRIVGAVYVWRGPLRARLGDVFLELTIPGHLNAQQTVAAIARESARFEASP